MNTVQLTFRMKDPDDTETEDDNFNAEETHPTRDEIIAEIRRIRNEVKSYPALSDFKKHSEYDTGAIYRHFDLYNDALKAAKATKQPLGDSSNTSESSSQLPDTDSSDSGVAQTSGESDEPQSKQGNKNPVDATVEQNSTGEPAAQTTENLTITVQITENQTPIRGAYVTVSDTDERGRQTDDLGYVEIPVPANRDQVPIRITQKRWASKDLDIKSGDHTTPYRLTISQSDWNTRPSDVHSSSPDSQNEASTDNVASNEDKPTDTVSKILRDIDRLDDE